MRCCIFTEQYLYFSHCILLYWLVLRQVGLVAVLASVAIMLGLTAAMYALVGMQQEQEDRAREVRGSSLANAHAASTDPAKQKCIVCLCAPVCHTLFCFENTQQHSVQRACVSTKCVCSTLIFLPGRCVTASQEPKFYRVQGKVTICHP